MNMKFKKIICLLLAALYVQSMAITTAVAKSSNENKVIDKNSQPEVVFKTNKGSFTLKLNPAKAPKTVENFLRYVDEGHYDNTLFHRAIPGFVLQGGGFEKGMKQKQTHKPVKN